MRLHAYRGAELYTFFYGLACPLCVSRARGRGGEGWRVGLCICIEYIMPALVGQVGIVRFLGFEDNQFVPTRVSHSPSLHIEGRRVAG